MEVFVVWIFVFLWSVWYRYFCRLFLLALDIDGEKSVVVDGFEEFIDVELGLLPPVGQGLSYFWVGQEDHGGLLVGFEGNAVCQLLLVIAWGWDCDVEVGLEVGSRGGRSELVFGVVAEGELLEFGWWDLDGGRGLHIWYFSYLCAALWILELYFLSEGGGGDIGDFGVVAEDGAASHIDIFILSGEVRYRMM